MSDIFSELNELALWDFALYSFAAESDLVEADLLVIRASRDFSYYHNAEVRFAGVEYVELPARFSHARFRTASAEETAALRRRVEFDGTVFCVIEERDSPGERVRYVVATSVIVDLTTVRYHAASSGDPP